MIHFRKSVQKRHYKVLLLSSGTQNELVGSSSMKSYSSIKYPMFARVMVKQEVTYLKDFLKIRVETLMSLVALRP